MTFKVYAHRGNTLENPYVENYPGLITETLARFGAEVDCWSRQNQFWLGHDHPQYAVSLEFLRKSSILVHAKTIKTFLDLSSAGGVHAFFQEKDDICVTTKGIFIVQGTLSRKQSPHQNAIFVDLDGSLAEDFRLDFSGVITDKPESYDALMKSVSGRANC